MRRAFLLGLALAGGVTMAIAGLGARGDADAASCETTQATFNGGEVTLEGGNCADLDERFAPRCVGGSLVNIYTITSSSDPTPSADDTLIGCSQVRRLIVRGHEGNDVILLTAVSPAKGFTSISVPSLLDGGTGGDRIEGGPQNDGISGGPGEDHLSGAGGADTVSGGAAEDAIRGGPGIDTLHAGDSGDSVSGGAGSDRIFGEEGNDILTGGGGADRLFGGPGGDFLFGRGGADLLSGGAAVDALVGGPGRDRLRGGPGADLERP